MRCLVVVLLTLGEAEAKAVADCQSERVPAIKAKPLALALLQAGALVDLQKSLREGQLQIKGLDKRSEQTKGAVARVEGRLASAEERIRKVARETGV